MVSAKHELKSHGWETHFAAPLPHTRYKKKLRILSPYGAVQGGVGFGARVQGKLVQPELLKSEIEALEDTTLLHLIGAIS